MELLDQLFALVKEHEASDLHFGEGYKPFLRIKGDLKEQEGFAPIERGEMEKAAKELLSEAQFERLSARNDIDFSFSHESFRMRGHAYHERGRLNLALRPLSLEVPLPDALGIPSSLVQYLMEESEGLFLMTGPTGSGKSTTIASLIEAFNQVKSFHIITIEDPIEYIFTSKKCLIKQREVGEYEGDVKTFSDALRSALREDPDIIFVGEMRDIATMRFALRAAETGHLVFSTLHTAYASQIPNRIVGSFPAWEQQQIRSQLAHALRGAVAQRLLPRRDGKGRVAAFEIMRTNPAIRNLIQEGNLQGIRDAMMTARQEGMILLEDAIKELKEREVV